MAPAHRLPCSPAARALTDPWLLGAVGLASGPWLVADPVVGAATWAAVASLIVKAAQATYSGGAQARPLGAWRSAPSSAARHAVLIGLLLSVVGSVRSGAALANAEARYERAAQALGPAAQCQGRAVVRSSPILRRGDSSGRRLGERDRRRGDPWESYAVTLELRSGDCDGRAIREPLGARLSGMPAGLGRGDELELIARIAPLELRRNPGLPDPYERVALTGVVATGRPLSIVAHERGGGIPRAIDAARARVRERIEQSYGPAHAPFARALVLGETDLDEDDKRAFARSGLAHLLAVSGTHLAIAVLAIVAALRALLARVPPIAARYDGGAIAAAVGIVLAVGYADFAGGSGSAARAAAMLSAALVARAMGRRASTMRCLAVTLGAAALVEPLVVCDPSFMLSVGATVGLMAGGRTLAATARSHGVFRRTVGAAVGSTIGATLGCTPILVSWGVDLPVLGVAANLLGAPLGEAVALPCCLAHAALWWLPAAEQGAARVASGALELVRLVAHAGAAPRWAALTLAQPTAEQLGALCVAGVGAALLAGVTGPPRAAPVRPSRVALLALAALVVGCFGLLEHAARQAAQPRGLLRVTLLDVGQGDALLIDLPNGQALLVDAGPGPPGDAGRRVLEPMLRARRRDRLDGVIVTHEHADHAGGLAALLGRVAVGELWLPDFRSDGTAGAGGGQAPPARSSAWQDRLLATLARAGIALRTPRDLCGSPVWLGGVRLEVLSPCTADARTSADPNHRSLVLKLGYGLRTVLLMADADAGAEQTIVDALGHGVPVDLLKVGHHGARTSTSAALIEANAPRLAAISVGARNRLGHPDPSVLGRLGAAGAMLWRTDRHGALQWQTDGLQVEVAGPDDW